MLHDRTPQVVADSNWKPLILSEFEIGQAMAAIESVARQDKPLAEVGCRIANRAELTHDLEACLASARETRQVFLWIREAGHHLRFGFYAEPWVLAALDFLEDESLQTVDRYWINGLLFGYRADAIQRFIDRSGGAKANEHSTNHSLNMVETAHQT